MIYLLHDTEVLILIKIAVCDDDGNMIQELKNKICDYMNKTSYNADILSFSSAEDLLKYDESFDIIFLDIQMSSLTGMEAAKRLRQSGSESFIIFVTILKEYVYDAFSVEAADYLLKPLNSQRFQSTMDRIIHYVLEKKTAVLTIQKGSWCQSVHFADILYCEAINRKIFVHTKQEIIDYYFRINELEKQLAPDFFCCHRSYLVNLHAVIGYENGQAKLVNGENIPVSRLRRQEFIEAMLIYMKKGDR
ncbi:LytR/AlgR family response regulator transcription factor [Clostridium boliviensis]|uniref:LytR/AlgR family response regulator transcription factor n=1 Tax=Clostridium boliviensis TaxID=318465 RepID=UPI0029650897|nr:LytTR family DNA-binding domain-containing protein [Clostridium boliviensis]